MKYENLIKHTENSGVTTMGENDSARYYFTTDFEHDKACGLVREFTDLAKTKGLTIRQAQQLFLVCSDYVMDSELK